MGANVFFQVNVECILHVGWLGFVQLSVGLPMPLWFLAGSKICSLDEWYEYLCLALVSPLLGNAFIGESRRRDRKKVRQHGCCEL